MHIVRRDQIDDLLAKTNTLPAPVNALIAEYYDPDLRVVFRGIQYRGMYWECEDMLNTIRNYEHAVYELSVHVVPRSAGPLRVYAHTSLRHFVHIWHTAPSPEWDVPVLESHIRDIFQCNGLMWCDGRYSLLV